MSKLNVDQKTVKELLENKKADFLIPDYQRPYAWDEKECQTLWDDVFSFAFPDNDYSKFDSNNDEYFLGPIVTFTNAEQKMEVIDGQQRLTTIMLLLRAFYVRFQNMQDEQSVSTREDIEKCIWKTNEFGKPDLNALKINSEVATDNDKDEFLSILKTGEAPKEMKSRYASNYRFFQLKIEDFIGKFPSYCAYLPTRILKNCILLPIEAESQDTALRIFSTLNDRGKPLSDADIFKAQFYKYYSGKGEKNVFIERWKQLEELCEKIFHPATGTPMDELFTRYMYFERAKKRIKLSTTEALRKFYERDNYLLLKNDYIFDNLVDLANFWNDISDQSVERFSNRILRLLFVLNYAPNGMWAYLLSVYYLQNRNKKGALDEELLCNFLQKTIGFVWAYALVNPGVNALRTPLFAEMVNIIDGKLVTYDSFKFDRNSVKAQFENYSFRNGRPITKSMLAWWAYLNEEQELISLETTLEIEHIFARNRQYNEKSLEDERSLESLGNKSLIEKRINIRASDYRFEDKKKYYLGFRNLRGQYKTGTLIRELMELAKNNDDYTENDIIRRNTDMINAFLLYLDKQKLIKE